MKVKRKSRPVKAWFSSLSLSSKIMMLVCLAGLLPVGFVLIVSVREIQHRSREQQIYALNQGYNQVRQSVEDKLTRVHNISTMLAVNDMVNLSLKISGKEESIAQQLAEFENIDSYTYGMEMAFESSSILFYIDENFPVVNRSSGRYRPLQDAKQTLWYADLDANNGRPTWVNFSEDIHDSEGKYAAVVRKLWDPDDFAVSIGVLAVLFERQALEGMLIGAIPGQVIYLETEDGRVLASNRGEEAFPCLPVGRRAVSETAFGETMLDGAAYLVRSSLVGKDNMYLVSLIPVKDMDQTVTGTNVRMWTLYLMVCIGSLAAFVPLTRSVTDRIQMLKDQIMQIQDGVIQKIEIKQQQTDEIGQLIGRYNDMTDKVEDLLKEQYVLGQEKTGAQLKALQSQINPHFLYNTLDMINWMAQKNETENIRSVVQAMSRFYRLTLSRGQDIVTIADEVRMCDAYMEIQKRRYKGRIRYEVEVEEDILKYLIPKITLQPFLENAIIHGINEKEDARGVVVLNGWLEDGRITLSVTDDGKGMEEERKNISSGSHYGMENIAGRLALFYGEEIPIQVESSLGVGTCIIINIPIRKEETEGERHEEK